MSTRTKARAEARAAGAKKYFTGSPCVHGHTAGRYVSSGQCVTCTHLGERRWHAANKDEFNARARARRKENPRATKNRDLKMLYGITVDKYEAMLAAQNGVCAVCKGLSTSGALYVDHCHESGLVRGLLCPSCNTALGLLRECPTRMDALKDYINAFRWLK